MTETTEDWQPPEGHQYVCPDCGFTSYGWPDQESADARGERHQTEHETGEPMPELVPQPEGSEEPAQEE